MEEIKNLTLTQKIMVALLYGLVILMIIFSVAATRNIGQEGYQRCVEKKCQERGENFCSKLRELNNCCMGAGGTLSTNQFSNELKHTACRFD